MRKKRCDLRTEENKPKQVSDHRDSFPIRCAVACGNHGSVHHCKNRLTPGKHVVDGYAGKMCRSRLTPLWGDFWSSTAKKSNASLAWPGEFRIAHFERSSALAARFGILSGGRQCTQACSSSRRFDKLPGWTSAHKETFSLRPPLMANPSRS